MAYTTIDDSSAHFQTLLYTGNGGSQTMTNDGNSDLQPDFLWIKQRSGTENHYLGNSSIANKFLNSDRTDTESTNISGKELTYNSDGFAFAGSDSTWNGSSSTYVAWQWKANGGSTTTNDASATGVGTIDSVYQANTTARFSIVTYSGSGSAGTIAHGLGVTPNWVIIKNRGSSARGWIVYHDKSHGTPEENFTLLNTTAGVADLDRMNDTAPTSTVFSVSDDTHVNNGSDTYVAYCFANVQGYSKFGSYTGTANANGPFVYTGFKPAWVLIRNTEDGEGWMLHDTTVDDATATGNPVERRFQVNENQAEVGTTTAFDFLSNGFKLRTDTTSHNGSGHNIIYMAFAEHPFVSSKGVPVTAR